MRNRRSALDGGINTDKVDTFDYDVYRIADF